MTDHELPMPAEDNGTREVVDDKLPPIFVPIESVDDDRLTILRQRKYSLDPEEGFDDQVYEQAVKIASGDREKTRRIYQELMRTRDMVRTVDRESPSADSGFDQIIAVYRFQNEVIQAIVDTQASRPSRRLPPEE